MFRLKTAFVAFFLLLLSSFSVGAQVIESIAVKVNDGIILSSDVERQIQRLKARIEAQKGVAPKSELLKQRIVEKLVLDNLQLQQSKQLGISISDLELQETLQNMASDNGLNLLQFHAALEKEGENFGVFVEEIRQQMLIKKLQQRVVRDRVTISSQEIDNEIARLDKTGDFAPEYRIGHILLTIDADDKSSAKIMRDKAIQISKALVGNANFKHMASVYSEGQQAVQGGILEWRKPEDMPSVIYNIIKTLEVGEVSAPVFDGESYHIVKLIGTRGGRHVIAQQYHVRHILKKTNEITTDDDVRNALGQIVSELQQGKNFEALARVHSEDLTNNHKGGDLGWRDLAEFVPEFSEQVKKLNRPGQISQPFRSRFGWHIVQLLDVREKDMADTYMKKRAEQRVFQRKFDEELQAWLRQLRDEAFVEYFI